MQRLVPAALLALVALPSAVVGQVPQARIGAENVRLRLTPYFAYMPAMTRVESRFLELGAEAGQYEAEFDLGTGYGAGLNVEFTVADPLFVYVDGAFVRRDDSREFSELEGGSRREAGSNWLVTRAGLGVRLRDPDDQLQLRTVSGSLFLGPSYIRELPRPDPFRTHADGMNLLGLNFGLQADVPLFATRFSLHAALEDNLVWWPNEELGRRNDSVYASVGLPTRTTVTTGSTHLLMVRLGLTYRY